MNEFSIFFPCPLPMAAGFTPEEVTLEAGGCLPKPPTPSFLCYLLETLACRSQSPWEVISGQSMCLSLQSSGCFARHPPPATPLLHGKSWAFLPTHSRSCPHCTMAACHPSSHTLCNGCCPKPSKCTSFPSLPQQSQDMGTFMICILQMGKLVLGR
jgi:hypothetical protein